MTTSRGDVFTTDMTDEQALAVLAAYDCVLYDISTGRLVLVTETNQLGGHTWPFNTAERELTAAVYGEPPELRVTYTGAAIKALEPITEAACSLLKDW